MPEFYDHLDTILPIMYRDLHIENRRKNAEKVRKLIKMDEVKQEFEGKINNDCISLKMDKFNENNYQRNLKSVEIQVDEITKYLGNELTIRGEIGNVLNIITPSGKIVKIVLTSRCGFEWSLIDND